MAFLSGTGEGGRVRMEEVIENHAVISDSSHYSRADRIRQSLESKIKESFPKAWRGRKWKKTKQNGTLHHEVSRCVIGHPGTFSEKDRIVFEKYGENS